MSDISGHPSQQAGWCGAGRSIRSLVTGGSGFLGHQLVATLAQAGNSVRVLDPIPPETLPGGVRHVTGSVTDAASARRALEGIDCVFHLAGIAHLWTPGRDDFDRVNRHGTEVMLTAAKEMAVPRFVHCSSYTTLLPQRKTMRAIDEAVAVNPTELAGPYSLSKYLGEEAARAAADAGQSVVIVNPTVLVGAKDRNFTPPTAMLAQFLSARVLWYVDLVLNIAHVQDVAAGIMLAAVRGRAGERYVLGGENLSLREVLDVLDRVSGRRRRRVRVPSAIAMAGGHAAGWIATHVTHRSPRATAEGVRLALRSVPLNIGKAQRELGYAPRPATVALTDAIRWVQSCSHRPAVDAMIQ
jgi:dihydroflavonol-4-reductase